MHLGRVRGTVVATVKSAGLEGVKLLVVQPLDENREPSGRCVVAADAVAMAGPGELVYYVASREAAQALEEDFVPVDHAIVGIVDCFDVVTTRAGSGDGTSTQPAEGGEPLPQTTPPHVRRPADSGADTPS